jgi:hypothetical protein
MMDLIEKYLGNEKEKKNEKVDEIFGMFAAGMVGGKSKRKNTPFSTKQMSSFPTGKLYDYFLDVMYHDEKDRMKAVNMVVKERNLDRKTAKELKKYVKKNLENVRKG